MTHEIWKAVVGYERRYEVSDLGRVRNRSGKVLSSHLTHDGYPRITLRNPERQMFTVHRLVAVAFLGPVPEGQQVNHKDGVKQNNWVGNLEYVTASENISHAFRVGLKAIGVEHHNAKLNPEKVRRIREGKESYAALAREFGVTRAAIYQICKGRSWVHVT